MFRIKPVYSNANNPSVTVPARSTIHYSAPIYIEREPLIRVEVFEDGRRLPNARENECRVMFTDSKNDCIGVLNDSSEGLGGFKKNPYLARKISQLVYRARTLPLHREGYDGLRALVVCAPDYSQYTSAAYAAIIEYVANGGLLVFVHPEGVLEAAETPLSALLPVHPLGVRKISHLEGLEDVLPRFTFGGLKGKDLEFLDSVEASEREGITLARHEGFPLLREMRYGLGTVRFLAFLPNRDNFHDNGELVDRLTARVLAAPLLNDSYIAHESCLDSLTGFSVPKIRIVQILLFSYFGLLIVLFLVFKRDHRGRNVWIAVVVLSLLYTMGVLYYAKQTVGKRDSLTAELRIENGCLPALAESYVSLFAPTGTSCRVAGKEQRNHFRAIPKGAWLRSGKLTVMERESSPLDLRNDAQGSMMIHDMWLAPRTARHYREGVSPQCLTLPESPASSHPRVLLGKEGISFEPWKAPIDASLIEGSFLVFPGGAKASRLNSDSMLTMEESEAVLANPLLGEFRKAVEQSYGKLHPAVVVQTSGTPVQKSSLQASSAQGKKLTLYPAALVPTSSEVTIPSDLLVLSSSHAVSRLLLPGNRVNHGYSIMGDYYAELDVMLPTALSQFEPETVRLVLRLTNRERITPAAELVTADGQHVAGQLNGDGDFVFAGRNLSTLISQENLSFRLIVRGNVKKSVADEQDFTNYNWSILRLEVSMRGHLPERLIGIEL